MSETIRTSEAVQTETETEAEGYPTIPNPERGCGSLKPNKAYLRADVGLGGELPAFVEFTEPIPFREDRLRSYKEFPGLSFELAMTGEGGITETVPEGEVMRHVDRLRMDRPTGEHAGEMVEYQSHDLLLSVGKTHYPTVRDFVDEAKIHGVSKAISVTSGNNPPVVNPGRTRLFLIHPNAIQKTVTLQKIAGEVTPDETIIKVEDEAYDDLLHADIADDVVVTVEKTMHLDGIFGYTYLTRVVHTTDEDGEVPEYIQKYARSGDLEIVKPGRPIPYSEQEWFDSEGNVLDEYRPMLDNYEGDLLDDSFEAEVMRQLEENLDEIRDFAENEMVVYDVEELPRLSTGVIADHGEVSVDVPPEEFDALMGGTVAGLLYYDGEMHKIVVSSAFTVDETSGDGVGHIGPYKLTVRDTDDGRIVTVESVR